jgi:hypothetical protein
MSDSQQSMGPRSIISPVCHLGPTDWEAFKVYGVDIAVVVILVAACGALAGGLGYWAVRIGRNR